MIMTNQPVECPHCERDLAQRFLIFAPAHLKQCRGCGLVYTSPRAESEQISRFFASHYILNAARLERELGSYRAESLRREAALLQRLKPSGRILDIGCAGGAFLDHLPAGVWEKHGVEPSSLAGEEASRRGVRVYRGLLSEAQIPRGVEFDAITCLDTLCLSMTPQADLQRMRELLRPDGVLLIDLPGYHYRLVRNLGPICWLINRRWTNFDHRSPHLFIFSAASLGKMLARAGMRIEQILPESAPARGSAALRALNRAWFSLGSALNRLSRGHLSVAPKVIYVCRRAN